MEHLDPLIIDLAMIMVTAGIVTLVFKKIKMPVVLGYIIAGFLIGPHFPWLPSVSSISSINIWANIGIIFLMFALGLEFSFKKISDMGAGPIITSLTVVICMVFVGFGVGVLMGWSRMDSIFLGGMLSMSSTMIILKAFEEYDLKNKKSSQIILGALVIEDICGIFMMIILSTISVGNNVSGIQLFSEIGKLMLFLVIWLAAGIFIIPTFLNKIKKLMNDETAVIVSLGICLLMVVIADKIGFSSALGAFLAGSIIAGTVSAERIEGLVAPVKNMFGAIFFVSVGMLVLPNMLLEYWLQILILTVVTIFGQMIFSSLGMLLAGQDMHTAFTGGAAMVQIGEFSFILATLGQSLGVISSFLYPIIVCVSVITIFTTPIFIKSSERIYRIALKVIPAKLQSAIEKNASEAPENPEKDNDWNRYLKKYMTRTLICCAALYFIYFTGANFLGIMSRVIGNEITPAVETVVALVFMIVPISVMLSGRGHLYTKLWLKNPANRIPLMTLRILRSMIALFFVGITIKHFLGTSFVIMALPILILFIVIVRTDYMRGRSIKLEARFVANINERVLHMRKADHTTTGRHVWLGDKLFVTEFTMSHCCRGYSIIDVFDNRFFDVMIMKIIRGDKHINMPGPDQMIVDGDRLQAVSSRDQLEAFILMLEKQEHLTTQGDLIPLREYMTLETLEHVEPENQIMCVAVPVKKEYFFADKTIKTSEFRNRYKGFIVGLEKNNLPIIDPSINTIIEKGDIMWVLGTAEMAEMMLEDGLLDETV
jgi:Kef-type K+ transport systems, membrane components